MLRALAWKEWREQRPVVLTAIGLAAVLPAFLFAGMRVATPGREVSDMAEVLPFLIAVILWPLFAAAAGASTMAPDAAAGSLPYLLSRPVSRARIWWIKVGAGLAAMVCVAAGTLAVSGLFYAVLYRGDARFTRALASALDLERAGAVELMWFAMPLVLLFSCSVFASTFTRSPLIAAAAGAALAVALGAALLAVWALVPGFGRGRVGLGALTAGDAFIVVGAPLAAAGVLLASMRAFRRDELGARRDGWAVARPLVMVVASVGLLGAGPMTLGATYDAARNATGFTLRSQAINGTIVVPEPGFAWLDTRLMLYSADAGRRPLGRRGGSSPLLSPDGRWVAYVARTPFAAMLGRPYEIRLASSDGSDDRLVTNWRFLGGAPVGGSFSPDSRRFIYRVDGSAWMVFGVDGSATPIGIDRQAFSSQYFMGWSEDNPDEVLLLRTRRPSGADGRRRELWGIDTATAEARLIHSFEEYLWIQPWGQVQRGAPARPGWRWLPVFLPRSGRDHQQAVSVADGELVPLTHSPAGIWGFTHDGREALYGTRTGRPRDANVGLNVRLRDLETGDDRLLAAFDGYYMYGLETYVPFSPDDEWVIVRLRRYPDTTRTVAISRAGEIRELGAAGVAIGWIDDRRALLAAPDYRDHEPGAPSLEIVDIEARTVVKFAPTSWRVADGGGS